MRKFLWAILAILVIAFSAPYANADSTESFNFSGTLTQSFMGNDSVTGTFTLDLTKGTITAFDFTTPVVTVDAKNGFGTVLNTFTPAVNPNTDFVQLNFFDSSGDGLHLFFQTDLASFSGNTFFTTVVETNGGTFSRTNLTCAIAGQCPPFFSNFTSGSATPITTAPEPASLLLLGSGLLGVAGIKRRRSGC